MVTLVTGDLEACRRFYTGVLQMRELGSVGTTDDLEALQALQSDMWVLPPGARWRTAHFVSPGLAGVPVLRVLEFERPGSLIRPDFDVRLEGGVSLGFAVRDVEAAERAAVAQGFEVAAHATTVPLRMSDGSSYLVTESVFRAPDEVYAFAIARAPPRPPVGPIAPGFNVGSPSYSCMVVRNTDEVVRFFESLLDFRVVHDRVTQGPEHEYILGLPPGARLRVVHMHAHGAFSGYVMFTDFLENGLPNPVPLGPPSRGIAMWSFRVRDLDEALARVRHFAAGANAGAARVLGGPARVPMPFGVGRVALVHTPNGFPVELMEV